MSRNNPNQEPDNSEQNNLWARSKERAIDLSKKTLAVLGAGAVIGYGVALSVDESVRLEGRQTIQGSEENNTITNALLNNMEGADEVSIKEVLSVIREEQGPADYTDSFVIPESAVDTNKLFSVDDSEWVSIEEEILKGIDEATP